MSKDITEADYCHCVIVCFLIREPAQCPSVSGQHSQPSTKSLSPSFLAAPPPPLPSLSSSEPPDCLSPFPASLSPCPPPLSPDSKRRLKELSHDLSLKQKISLALIWALASFYGLTACFPEKVRRANKSNYYYCLAWGSSIYFLLRYLDWN